VRKRSKYRPKKVLLNPVGFVLEGFIPVRDHDQILLDLKVKHHSAMTALTQGVATYQDIDALIAAINMTEALSRLGFGEEYCNEVRDGLAALRAVGARGAANGFKFILRSSEMNALNTAIELHDAQLEVITLRDMERAIEIVQKEFATGKATPITGVKNGN
jgi:hypothetical protein